MNKGFFSINYSIKAEKNKELFVFLLKKEVFLCQHKQKRLVCVFCAGFLRSCCFLDVLQSSLLFKLFLKYTF